MVAQGKEYSTARWGARGALVPSASASSAAAPQPPQLKGTQIATCQSLRRAERRNGLVAARRSAAGRARASLGGGDDGARRIDEGGAVRQHVHG